MGRICHLVLILLRRFISTNYNKLDGILNGKKDLIERRIIQNKARIRGDINPYDKLEKIHLTNLNICRIIKKFIWETSIIGDFRSTRQHNQL